MTRSLVRFTSAFRLSLRATFGLSMLLSLAVQLASGSSQANDNLPSHDFIPEVLARDSGWQNITGLSRETGTAFDSDEIARTWADPLYGYRLIAVVDVSSRGATPTSQTISIFRLDAGHFRTIAQWLVTTGLEQPYFENGKLVSKRNTRPGFYRAQFLDPNYVSASYQLPMPFAVFYDRSFGVAIHAALTDELAVLGSRGSYGCTRTAPENAEAFFNMVVATPIKPLIKMQPFPQSQMGTPELDARGQPTVVRGHAVMIINTDPTQLRAAVNFPVASILRHPDLLFSIIR